MGDSQKPKPSVLIAAGFHGDEPAGVLAVEKFITERVMNYSSVINISFLRCVNASGFEAKKRTNAEGLDPNRGYVRGILSEEGEALMQNHAVLIDAAADGYLSLHEDVDETKGYMYAHNDDGAAIRLLNVMQKFFPLDYEAAAKENVFSRIPGLIPAETIYDDSFEEWLYRNTNAPIYVTETPALHKLEKRVDCCVELIEEFLKGYVNDKG